jgi:hypothetical protein
VTARTVFHRTRTGLLKCFLAACLTGRDKRGVSAKLLQRELAVAYQTAWTTSHKLRHGLGEDPARPLRGFWRRTRPSSAAVVMLRRDDQGEKPAYTWRAFAARAAEAAEDRL